MWNQFKAKEEYAEAVLGEHDRWVAACGGMESPMETPHGRWLYVFNPGRQRHGWLNMGTDLVQTESPFAGRA